MDCPVCKNPMITMELADVEIDYCNGCNGIWLDEGEMEAILGNRGKSQELIASFRKSAQTDEKPRKCPICDKSMEKITAGRNDSAPLIDRCVNADGLWFDKGELNNIIQNATLDEDNKIKKLLVDMFGDIRS